MFEQCVCRECGETRMEQVGSEAAYEKSCSDCVERLEQDSAEAMKHKDPSAYMRELGYIFANSTWVYQPYAKREVCKCAGPHVYVDSVESGNELGLLDGFYCATTNQFWREA